MKILLLLLIYILFDVSKCGVEDVEKNSTSELAGANIEGAEHAMEIHNKNKNNYSANIMSSIHANGRCQGKNEDWSCQSDCKLQHVPPTGKCQLPSGEICFGTEINYNYTRNSIAMPNFDKWEILKRFPACWESFSPLVCAFLYRPCKTTQCYAPSVNNDVPFPCEVWQKYPISLCNNAIDNCKFITDIGLWPDVLDCNNTIDYSKDLNSTFLTNSSMLSFSEKCKMRYREKPSFPPNFQCIWPLVTNSIDTDAIFNVSAIIDSCYLPCKSPLLDSINEFQNGYFVLVAVIFFILSLFNMFYTYFKTNVLVFTFSYVISIIYFGLYSLSHFDYFFYWSQCVDNRTIRRDAKYHNFYDLCEIQAWCSLMFFMSMVFYRFFFSFTLLKWDTLTQELWVMRKNFLMILGVPLIMLISSITVTKYGFINIYVDGMSGVCYFKSQLFIWLYVSIELIMLIFEYKCRIDHQKKTGLTYIKTTKHNKTTLPNCGESNILLNDSNMEALNNGNKLKQVCIQDFFLRHDGISMFIVLRILLILFYLISIYFVYSLTLATDVENESILESIRCSLNTSIRSNSMKWWNNPTNFDDQIGSPDPHLRKLKFKPFINAPGCELMPLSYSQKWILLFKLLILPGIWLLMHSYTLKINVDVYPPFDDSIANVSGERKEAINETELIALNTDNLSTKNSHQSEEYDHFSENGLNEVQKYCRSESPSYEPVYSLLQNRPHSIANLPVRTYQNSESFSGITQTQGYYTKEQMDILFEKYRFVVESNRNLNRTLTDASKAIELLQSNSMALEDENNRLKEEVTRLKNFFHESISTSENNISSADAQSSASSAGSDDFDSDEPDSEEERLFNQRLVKNQEASNIQANRTNPDVIN